MKLLNRSAITLRAKEPFYTWIAALPADDEALAVPATLEELRREGNVYLLDEVEQEEDYRTQLQAQWQAIFENELSAWDEFGDHWPNALSEALFNDWFAVQPQVMVFDTTHSPLLVADLEQLG